ncbi:MAG: PilN domain-containing protein [Deltaproteobacteria bacterium]|nr:PilN domain-containing protein [Deltaproteobacteria bacterium]
MAAKHPRRINFLETEGFSLTYARLGMCACLWLMLLAGWFGSGWLRIYLVQRDIYTTKAQLTTLDREKEERLAHASTTVRRKMGQTAQEGLRAHFGKTFKWSDVFEDIGQRLPHQTWLTALQPQGAPTPEGTLKLHMQGKAKRMESIPMFVGELKKSSYFQKPEILGTQGADKDGFFEFSLLSEIVVNK